MNGAFIFPTTTPVQFDPEELVSSVSRLMARSPEFMYLTHFGRVGDTHRLAAQMIAGVHKLVEIGEKNAASPRRTQDIKRDMLEWLVTAARAHGVTLPETRLHDLIKTDLELNTQGIEYWLDHRRT